VFSSIASVLLVLVLLAAFLTESVRDVSIYYRFRTINPLYAGVVAVGVVLAFAATWFGWLSEPLGSGIALGLAVVSLLIVLAWAVTGRVDVFVARGWAYPAQRWVLVAISVLIVLGASVRAWRLGLFSAGR
jgi:hypothetical protein